MGKRWRRYGKGANFSLGGRANEFLRWAKVRTRTTGTRRRKKRSSDDKNK